MADRRWIKIFNNMQDVPTSNLRNRMPNMPLRIQFKNNPQKYYQTPTKIGTSTTIQNN